MSEVKNNKLDYVLSTRKESKKYLMTSKKTENDGISGILVYIKYCEPFGRQ